MADSAAAGSGSEKRLWKSQLDQMPWSKKISVAEYCLLVIQA